MSQFTLLSSQQQKQIAALAGIIVGSVLLQKALIDTAVVNPFVTLNLLHLAINIVLAVSLNLINGFTGQFSIGHAGFMAIGAYVSAVITVNFSAPIVSALGLGFLPEAVQSQAVFLIGILAGAVASALIGFLIGLPTLRLRGDYLAIATLGFGEIIRIVIINIDYVGGPRGLMGIPEHTNVVWAISLAAITTMAIYNFTRSTHGRACVSIREDEIAAEAMGVNTTRYKVMAFTIGSFFAGVGGALFAHVVRIASPASFTFMRSVDILVMVVLGGLGSLAGSVVAAIIVTVFSAAMADYPAARMIAYSALLIVLMLFRPQGIMGQRNFVSQMVRRLKGGKTNVTP